MRQRWSDGSVLRIKLSGGTAHCQMIRRPFFAFFDEFTSDNPDIALDAPILFRIAVADTAFNTSRWMIVGRRQSSSDVSAPLLFYRQDHFTKRLSIMNENGYETAASVEQCHTLERAAVWEPAHVEDRLEDHMAGRPNKWLLSMAISE